jgi:hypothetical protein
MTNQKFIYDYVLVNTARTWERLRVATPNKEMPFDNIGSVEEIIKVAENIYSGEIIQGFINASEDVRRDYWIENTIQGFSDIFIEEMAEILICDWYL